MKLLLLDENYPHQDNLLGSVFTHVRVKEYIRSHTVKVFSFFHERRDLEYEGVELSLYNDISCLRNAILDYDPDKIIIHFYKPWMLEPIIKGTKCPIIVWVHGYEVIAWYRRLFNWNTISPLLIRNILQNIKQQYQVRSFIQFANDSKRIKFVFVSKWMKRITELDTASRIKNYYIIPNPINTSLFAYREKKPDQRLKVLLLRSFESRKYANDISIDAIKHLSGRPCFKEFDFRIIGVGGKQNFDLAVEPISHFDNVHCEYGTIQQQFIPEVHKDYGIFLCPTRQDSQGVSMCEAMASGLVPLTSKNTAIPEFVDHNISGILTGSSLELADALESLYHDAEKFMRLSKAAAASVQKNCRLEKVVLEELALIDEH